MPFLINVNYVGRRVLLNCIVGNMLEYDVDNMHPIEWGVEILLVILS